MRRAQVSQRKRRRCSAEALLTAQALALPSGQKTKNKRIKGN